MAGYVAPHQLLSLAHSEPGRRALFGNFDKLPFVISLQYSPFPLKQTSVFLDVLDKEYSSLSVSKYD